MTQHHKEFEEFKVFTWIEMDKKDHKALRMKNIQNTFMEVGGIVKELLAGISPP